MASSGGMVKVAVVLVIICMVVAAPVHVQAVTCTEVATYLSSCVAVVAFPAFASAACCTGAKTLFSPDQTSNPQRQDACKCLKSATGAISVVDIGIVFSILKVCGVNVPSISKDVDCSKVP